MRILVVSQYYYPEHFRINDICEELVDRGHRVTVLTGLPNYPKGTIYKGYENRFKEIHNRVNIIRCKTRPRKTGTVNLALNYISFAFKASLAIGKLKQEYDLIFSYQLSPITSVIPAIIYKWKEKKPLCLFCCDIWPESIKDVVDNPFVFNICQFVSKKIYAKADSLLVKSPSFIDYLGEMAGISKKMMTYVPEYVEDEYLEIDSLPVDNDCIDFFFMGNIGMSQNCDLIIRAASQIPTDMNFKIHFVGDGSKLAELQGLVEQLGMGDRVIFHGRYPLSEMHKFYEMADVCLLTLANTTRIGLTLPAKLPGYMAASRPVLAAIEGDAKVIIEESGCGICVSPTDVEGFKKGLLYCIEHTSELETMGKAGRDYFMKVFEKNKCMDLLEKELDECIVRYRSVNK